MQRVAGAFTLAMAMVLLFLAVGMVPPALGEEKKLELREADTMADLLGRLVGTTVELTLRNGSSLSGRLAKVHQHVLVLASLRGKEFYDAVIRVEDVSAVTVRMRER